MIDTVRTALEKHTGPIADPEMITDRRGVQVWRVTATGGPDAVPEQRLAVKIPTDASTDGAFASRREIAVLLAIARQTVETREPLLVGDGFTLGPWFDGPSTLRTFKPLRTSESPSEEDRICAALAGEHFCRAVAELHRLGWVHGDLQGAHCIHTKQGARLIDFATAQGPAPLPESELNRPYVGALAHLEAPELAAPLSAGDYAEPTYASDVYALGASLWTALTGQWPLDYGAHGLNPAEIPLRTLRYAIGTGRLPLAPSRAWPELLGKIAPALAPVPADRPTAAQLADEIRDVSA